MKNDKFIQEVIKNMIRVFWALVCIMGFGIVGIIPIALFKKYIDSPLCIILSLIWFIFYVSLVISTIYAWLKDE